MSGKDLQLIPGVVQEYSCYCSRKTKILKRWTHADIAVIKNHAQTGFRVVDRDKDSFEHLFDITQEGVDNLIVEFIDNDPHEPDNFLGISVTCKTDNSVSILRMKDIAQQRWLMACLGATGRGLFSPVLGVEERKLETHWTGIWDITHAVEALQSPEDLSKAILQDTEPSAGKELPKYAERDMSVYMKVPSYQSGEDQGISSQPLKILQDGVKVVNRQQHDTFLPPIGPPVYVPISIGFGLEIGLETGLQELWDPVAKSCIFIDHSKQQTFYRDPRALKQPPPKLDCKQIIYGPDRLCEGMPPTDESSALVQFHLDKAVGKRDKWGAWIIAKGIDGMSGAAGLPGGSGYQGEVGVNGKSGSCGFSGHSGGPGGVGWPGNPGIDGEPARHGTNGSDLSLYISGNSENLRITGSLEECIDLGGQDSEHVLCVDCTGGHGGHGGPGGPGGSGGMGGKGGHGGRGGSGSGSSSGGRGGNGGVGGQGGIGGYGGRGGNAANSGSGGHCVIHTSEPRLLHLVELSVSAGQPGKGGQGGIGGVGGAGGEGGHGGSGGFGGSDGGSSGFSGSKGIDGPPGVNGPNGPLGYEGIRGRDGGLFFVLLTPDGENVIEQSGYRYHVQVDQKSLKINSFVDDGIFEPNEQITVYSFSLQNIGNMTLPEGAIVSMASTPTVKFLPTKLPLPVLAPQQSMDITQEFVGRIYDVPPPNTQGPYLGEAYFETRVDLVGRPFESAKTIHRIIVQYPIKLDAIAMPESCGRGEQQSVYISLTNISSVAYGNFPESGGQVGLKIHFDKRLLPFANASDETQKPYRINYDPNSPDSCYVDVTHIAATSKLTVTFNLALSNTAELFDRCPLQIDILLRGKLIEYRQLFIRVTPYYITSNPPADILFVTDKTITRKEFILWQRLFELLGVSVDFWDKDRYEGFSYLGTTRCRHEVSWINKHSGSLIFFPNSPFHYFDPIDVMTHLRDNSRVGNDPNAVPNDAGVLFIHSIGENERKVSTIKAYIKNMCLQGTKVALGGKDYGGNHMTGPNEDDIKEKQTEAIKHCESEQPGNRYFITDIQNNPERLKLLSFTYGMLSLHSMPIERSNKFMIVTRSVHNFGLDDTNLSVGQLEIPLANDWGQTLLYILYGVPIHVKLSILRGHREEEVSTVFVTPAGTRLSLVELAEMCLTKEIIAEITCLTIEMPKLAALATSILDDLENFCKNSIHIFALIIAVKIFAEENTPKKHKEIKTKVINYYQQIKNRMIEFGGSDARKQFDTAKELSGKKRIYFDNLVNSGHTFEPHTYNLNKLNDDLTYL